MKRWTLVLGVLLAILPISSYAAESKETPTSLKGVTIVSAETVKKWLDKGEDVLIIDARGESDYAENHLPDAENCSVPGDFDVSDAVIQKSVDMLGKCEALKSLKKDAKIVAYCNSFT